MMNTVKNPKPPKCKKCGETTEQSLRGYCEDWEMFRCLHCGKVYKVDKVVNPEVKKYI